MMDEPRICVIRLVRNPAVFALGNHDSGRRRKIFERIVAAQKLMFQGDAKCRIRSVPNFEFHFAAPVGL